MSGGRYCNSSKHFTKHLTLTFPLSTSSRAGFLNPWQYWHWVLGNSLLWGPVHCGLFSSIPGLYPLHTSSSLFKQLWQPKISPDIAECPLEDKADPTAESHCSQREHDCTKLSSERLSNSPRDRTGNWKNGAGWEEGRDRNKRANRKHINGMLIWWLFHVPLYGVNVSFILSYPLHWKRKINMNKNLESLLEPTVLNLLCMKY